MTEKSIYKSHIKMGKYILTFADIKIEKDKFCRLKIPIFIEDVDIEKVSVSNKIYFGKKSYKYFISY